MDKTIRTVATNLFRGRNPGILVLFLFLATCVPHDYRARYSTSMLFTFSGMVANTCQRQSDEPGALDFGADRRRFHRHVEMHPRLAHEQTRLERLFDAG